MGIMQKPPHYISKVFYGSILEPVNSARAVLAGGAKAIVCVPEIF